MVLFMRGVESELMFFFNPVIGQESEKLLEIAASFYY